MGTLARQWLASRPRVANLRLSQQSREPSVVLNWGESAAVFASDQLESLAAFFAEKMNGVNRDLTIGG